MTMYIPIETKVHKAAKFGVFVDEDHNKLATLYWLPKLHKRPQKPRYFM